MILLDLGQAAAKLNCSERWLADNLRAGRFPGKKIMRKWMLTADDISTILQICSTNHIPPFSVDSSVSHAPSSSMTKTTLRRLNKVATTGNACPHAPAVVVSPTHIEPRRTPRRLD
jgi:hypothetical protein